MTKRLAANLPDGIMNALEHIAQVSGKNKTEVVIGMIEHWAVVVAEQERRGFRVVPTSEASLASAMIAERTGAFDDPALGGIIPGGVPGRPADLSIATTSQLNGMPALATG